METKKHYLQRGREALGLSREDVATALGVKPRTIKAWELGTRKPDRDSYDAWARFLIGRAEKVIADTLERRRTREAEERVTKAAIEATLAELAEQQAAEMDLIYGEKGAEAFRARQFGAEAPLPRRHDTERITRATTDRERNAVAFVEAYEPSGHHPARDGFMAAMRHQLQAGKRLSPKEITTVLRIEKNEAPLPKKGGMRAKRKPRMV